MQVDNNGSGSRRSIGMGKRFGCGGSSGEALEKAAIFAGADKSDLGATLQNSIQRSRKSIQ